MLLPVRSYRTPLWLRPGRLGYWLTCLGPALAAAAFFAWLYLRPPLRLTLAGTQTAAALTLVSCKTPPIVRYAFDADGRTYFGTASPAAFAIPCRDLQVGAQVPIVYLPTDPSRSAGLAGLERAEWAGAIITGVGFAIVFAGIAALLWVYARPLAPHDVGA
jgi:uncharacterized protein DUF3592